MQVRDLISDLFVTGMWNNNTDAELQSRRFQSYLICFKF